MFRTISHKFGLLLTVGAALLLAPAAAQAQKKDQVTIGMTLEPPGLDSTAGAAAAIGEITHYNIYEGLTKIRENGEVEPLLAESWTNTPDLKTWTFKLKTGVKFSDGVPFTSATVKSAFERYASDASTNKRKADFTNIARIDTPDAQTVIITLKEPNGIWLFNLGENTSVITAAESAATNATKPVGTGPFKFDSWVKGSSVTLVKSPAYRNAGSIKLNKVVFKFISDPAAATASLLAGDIDVFPRFPAPESVGQFQVDKRFTVMTGSTEGETILTINNKRKPFDDVRVRRAISHAIDRSAIVAGAMYGFGIPIGSHFPPHNPAYVDLTNVYPYDPAKAKALLAEAGQSNLTVSLKLPPPPYARRGGEIVAAELTAIGIKVNIENIDFAQWLDVVFKNHNFDLTIISHVEPNDIRSIFTDPTYYIGYDSAEFRGIIAKAVGTADVKEQTRWLQAAQRKLADDAAVGWLFELANIMVYKKGLAGFWKNAPIFVNDMSSVSWN